ncbi:Protein of unknown function [Propionibacterium freudenreichii]|uniref:hypothetical protein n=1 Tax=Propionibacterium freudenreichii TaxID=1744 RepID=UPI0005428EB9|nr:hypothetical protein [Propionibacterium freudenreichii]CEH05781.1 Protein of unknown function [Propionibacterium freudenreichii]
MSKSTHPKRPYRQLIDPNLDHRRDPAIADAKGRLARLYLGNPTPDPAAVAEAKGDLNTAVLARHIADALAKGPAFTPEQTDFLVSMLLDAAVER